MFNLFKKNKPAPNADIPQLLGLKLGGAIELNSLKFKLLEAQLTVENMEKTQLIQAVGVVQLDVNDYIVRYYTDDDGFIQIVVNGGLSDNHISDVKLWYFYDTLGISSEQDWERTINAEISQAEAVVEGHTFQRYWNNTGSNPPVAMTETTYFEQQNQSETDQFIMLYEREITADLAEFLMISGEEKETQQQLERCLVRSTGINLSSADFEIIA